MVEDKSLYSINDLVVDYHTRLGALRAVDHVSFEIQRGDVLGLVGESGCGKSTLGKAMMRMIQEPGRITSGELWFDGRDLMKASDEEMRQLRGSRISMVFQDPMTSLNPVQQIIEHLTETIRTHENSVSEKEAQERAKELVTKLGIRSERLDDYPHQLSGGMRQRIMISLALALYSDIVIADEATTSLDVIVEAQFLELLRELKDEFNLTLILITHNIGVVAEMATRVAVMYAGNLVELRDVYKIFGDPLHPYTEGLLNSVPNIKLDDKELYKMPGAPPNLLNPPEGCRFHPRCLKAMEICRHTPPNFQMIDAGEYVACWLYEEHPEIQEGAGNDD
jgi:oligopeptide/dipeptide ABC transporter ATP-binding protein